MLKDLLYAEDMFGSLGDLITLNIFYESSRYNVVKKRVGREGQVAL